MSNERPYSRVYHELAEEYQSVYDGPDLADYVRLLVAADQAFPTRARWAGYTTSRVLRRLEACGLVAVDGARYSVKGMEKERAARAERARTAAYASHASSSARGSATSRAGGTARPNAPSLPRRDETRRDEPSPGDPDAFAAYERLTMSYPKGRGAPWLSRLIDEHGEARTERALIDAWADNPDPSKLLGVAEGLLGKRAHESAKVAEERRKRGAIDELHELEERISQATPEERARADALREQIGAFVKGVA